MNQEEKKIHKALCNYIKTKYPKVIFTSDQSGLKVSIGVAKQLKESRNPERGIPDLIILEPRKHYNGLCIEIKKSEEEIYTQNGDFRNNQHIKEQRNVLDKLRRKGYDAEFGAGLDNCIKIVDYYMNLEE